MGEFWSYSTYTRTDLTTCHLKKAWLSTLPAYRPGWDAHSPTSPAFSGTRCPCQQTLTCTPSAGPWSQTAEPEACLKKKQDIETPKELSFTRDLTGDVRSGHQFFHVRQFFCQSAANCNYTSFTNHSQQPSTWNSVLNKGKGVNQTICKDNPFESYYEAGHWHWNDRKTILALRHFCSKPTTEIKYWRYHKHCRYWIFVADSSNRINK